MAVELDREKYQQIFDEIETVDEERLADCGKLRSEIAGLRNVIQSLETRLSELELQVATGSFRK